MSTRYMKKVFGDSVVLETDKENVSDVESSVTGNFKSKSFNVFDVLNDNSETESEVIEDGDDSSISNTKRKKKKKKKKKIDSIKTQQKYDMNDEKIDEIERTVREVNKLLGEPIPESSQVHSEKSQWIEQTCKEDILMVQHKHLNPFNELKKIFGSKTIQAEQSKRRPRRRTTHLKKTWLVSPRDTWPSIRKSGLSMTLDFHNTMISPEKVQYFDYEHDETYKQTQLQFLKAVGRSNPQSLVNVINSHPYHVDTCLQLAELCKLSEDLPMAAEFTERALYCLECGFHPMFNITTAHCRMDYRKQENRALFITLFKHLVFVGGRACYRTSLEFCKLLLSLDPKGDPLAAVLFIDFYALRAREYKWFIEFCNLWENSRNLTQLPNIAYSLALAHFFLDNITTANELLQNAVIMFPGVLMPLLDKCNVQPDLRVTSHEFFVRKAKSTTPPALEKLQNLYIARIYHLWKESNVMQWLEQCVHEVLNRVDSQDNFVKDCEVKRSRRYQGILPKNILRHIILADIKEITVNSDEIQDVGPVLSYDPLPPADTINTYDRPIMRSLTHLDNWDLFSLFFSSLFTDIDADAAAAAVNGVNGLEENNEPNA